MSSELNKHFTKTVRISGEGETRQRAFASALNNIRNEVIKDESQVTLQIIPEQVRVRNAQKVTWTEKFLFFFFKRRRVNYKITLDVDVQMNVVKLEDVDFVETEIPSPDHINLPDFTKLLRGNK